MTSTKSNLSCGKEYSTELVVCSPTGQGILRVASCKLRVASSSCECELRVRVASSSCELRVEMCELRVSVCEFNSTHTLRVEHCELRVSHICELNDFGFQCDLSACVCLR